MNVLATTADLHIVLLTQILSEHDFLRKRF